MVLRNTIANTLTQILSGPNYSTEWRVLVLDKNALQILSSAASVSDLSDKGVAVVESLEKNRQPLPKMDAVYLIDPTHMSGYSVDLLIQDFTPDKKGAVKYKSAHVFLARPMTPETIAKLKQSSVIPYLDSLSVVNLSFLAHESNLFSFNDKLGLYKLYSPKFDDTVRQQYYQDIASRLACLCEAIAGSERFYVGFDVYSPHAKHVAKHVQSCIDANNRTPTRGDNQIVIIDRQFDAITALIHDLNYEAICRDVLPIDPLTNVYEGKTNNTTGILSVDGNLDEIDQFWKSNRFQFYPEASDELAKEVADIAASQQTAQRHKTSSNTNPNKKMTPKELSEIIRQRSAQTKKVRNIAIHVELVEQINKMLDENALHDLIDQEQNMVTGIDGQSNAPIKNHLPNLIKLFQTHGSKMNQADKVRLLALYIISKQNGTPSSDLQKLFESTIRNDSQGQDAVRNLALMGLKVTSDQSVFIDSPWINERPKRKAPSTFYKEARWVPAIQDLLEYLTNSLADASAYKKGIQFQSGVPPILSGEPAKDRDYGSKSMPSSSDAAPGSSTDKGHAGAQDVHEPRKPAWATKKKTGNQPSSSDRNANHSGALGPDSPTSPTSSGYAKAGESKPKIVVFVLGGVTFSEVRVADKIAKANPKHQLILGGCSLLKPQAVITSLQGLRSDSEHLLNRL